MRFQHLTLAMLASMEKQAFEHLVCWVVKGSKFARRYPQRRLMFQIRSARISRVLSESALASILHLARTHSAKTYRFVVYIQAAMPRPVDGFESLHAEDQQRGQVAQILLKSGGSDVIRIQHYWTSDLASQPRNVKPAGYRSHVPPGHSRKIPQRGALDECLVAAGDMLEHLPEPQTELSAMAAFPTSRTTECAGYLRRSWSSPGLAAARQGPAASGSR